MAAHIDRHRCLKIDVAAHRCFYFRTAHIDLTMAAHRCLKIDLTLSLHILILLRLRKGV